MKLRKNISLEKIVAELENKNPEDFERSEIITDKEWKDEEGNRYKTAYYTWEGYKTKSDDYKIFIEKGEVNIHGEDSSIDNPSVYDANNSLGFRLRVFEGKKVIRKFKGDRLEEIYNAIKNKELKAFDEIIEKLTPKTPEYWEKATESWSTIAKNLVATGFFYDAEMYATKVDDLSVSLVELKQTCGDIIGGMLMPSPYGSALDTIIYRLQILKDGKMVKAFEGEDFTPFIKSSIEILRDYHQQKKKEKEEISNYID